MVSSSSTTRPTRPSPRPTSTPSSTAYELQGAALRVALEAATAARVVDCRFVFCQPNRAIERSVVDLPKAMERVRQVVAVAAAI